VTPLEELLQKGPVVVNVGVRAFAEAVDEQGAQVVHVEWRPPPEVDPDLAELLKDLL
jgi:hypothetical protein